MGCGPYGGGGGGERIRPIRFQSNIINQWLFLFLKKKSYGLGGRDELIVGWRA